MKMSNIQRKTKDQYYMEIAKEIASKSTCLRANHGAVIVNDNEVISIGYNNAPEETKNCTEHGVCLRSKLNIPRGERYEMCRSVHAEQNAIINAAKIDKSIMGGKMYLYSILLDKDGNKELIDALPCLLCKKMLMNSGLKELITQQKDGNLKSYKISDWIKECKNKDIIESRDQYGKNKK